ncbi:hypothetical protein DER44DRAFT_675515, partial [Fusarium oxysporum]
YYYCIYIPYFGYYLLNINSKPVLNINNLYIILIFNITFNTLICPSKWYYINLAGYY